MAEISYSPRIERLLVDQNWHPQRSTISIIQFKLIGGLRVVVASGGWCFYCSRKSDN